MATSALVFSQSPIVGQANLVFGLQDGQDVRPTTELVFYQSAATYPAELVFGDDGDADTQPLNASVVIRATLSPLSGRVRLAAGLPVSVRAVLPLLRGRVPMRYATDTSRPTVGSVRSRWQDASPVQTGQRHRWQDALKLDALTASRWQDAAPTRTQVASRWQEADSIRVTTLTHWQDAAKLRQSTEALFQEALRSERASATTWQNADKLHQAAAVRFQEALRDRRASVDARWQDARRLQNAVSDSAQPSVPVYSSWSARWQNAMQPGIAQVITPPVVGERCYTPNPHLLFALPWPASPALLFYCDRDSIAPSIPTETSIVLVKEVYMVFNNATLRRIDGNILIPDFDMELSIDADSWTWSISASMPANQLANLEPSVAGGPVEVEATVNGVAYRALVESISRERQFGKATIRIGCRGRSALLDAPYSPVQSFGHSVDRTAQQLMNDVLTINNVSLGWAVNWSPVDWLVPANVFSHRGTYISALNQIAVAAGAYIQPHATDKSINVLLRYPKAPWEWATGITPDYQLPAAVTTRESITWQEKARYNRVFVSGAGLGVLGQVTRAGTAGDVVAPMITDSLITQAAAARQRGIPILSNTGRMADVKLSLPVLPQTGIIMPGKFVDFVDENVTRRGIVRSVQVSISFPEIFQTIDVETHING